MQFSYERIFSVEKYTNSFEMTENLYLEVLNKMVPQGRYAVYAIATVFLAISSFVMFIGKNFKVGIIWFLLALFLAAYGFLGISLKAKKIYRQSFAELCDANGKFWKKSEFFEKTFKISEPTSKATFYYSDILGVNESKNCYIFMMKDKKLLFVKKGCFADATDKDFIDFLKAKCNVKD